MDYSVFVPKNIPWTEFPPDSVWKYELVLQRLAVFTHLRSFDRQDALWDRMHLSANTLRTLIGGDYNKVMKDLEHRNIIWRDHDHYCHNPGNAFAKTTMLTHPYREYELRPIAVKTALRVNNIDRADFVSQMKAVEDKCGFSTDIYAHIEECIWSRTNVEATPAEIDYVMNMRAKWRDVKEPNYLDRLLLQRFDKHYHLDCSISEKCFRLYTPVSTMRSITRGLLRGDNRKLIELDLKTSQIALLLVECMKEGFGTRQELQHWIDEIEKDDGDLYYRFAIGLQLNGKTRKEKRDNMKYNYLFHTMFGPIRDDDKLFQFIQKDCPPFAKYMLAKKHGRTHIKRLYSQFAIFAQTIEARFLFSIIGEFIKRHPDAYIVSIHDAVLCHPEYADEIREIITLWSKERGICLRTTPKKLLLENTQDGYVCLMPKSGR